MNGANAYFINKKTIVSYILSLLVFFIHFRVFSAFKDINGFLGYLLDQLLLLTKVAVPLFFIISGALFYRNYNWAVTTNKWKSRFFSLCIPYLTWNTFWLLLALLGYYTPLGMLLGGVKAPLSLKNVLNGIFLYGYFEPFWFILQLIVLTACAPIIYLILKNKRVGLIGIFVYFILSCFDFKFNTILLPNSNMVLVYLIGAWIGIHHFTVFSSRKSKMQALIGLFLYILCCVFHGAAKRLPDWCLTFQIPFLVTILSCGAFWTAFDFFDMQKCPQYMSYSFLIYALHSFIGAFISKILCMLIPANQWNLSLIAVITFCTTIAIITCVGRLLDTYFPFLKQILTGR